MKLVRVTEPAQEFITLADVEGQTRLQGLLSAEADTVEMMISAVRERAESVTRRALVTQVWELTLDAFPASREAITLPLPPLQSVDFIKYIDFNGNEQTLDPLTYRVGKASEPGYVKPLYNINWPATLQDSDVVTVRFTCGYGPIAPSTSNNVPKAIKQWCLINVANLVENRETLGVAYRETKYDLSTLADGLIENYRITRL